MPFKTPIDSRTWDGVWYTILTEYEVVWSGGRLIVHKGFTTDFASVPRFAWRICPPWGLSMRAAAAHDKIYNNPETVFSRSDADIMFLEVMREDGVSWLQRRLMYQAVKWFGWKRWNEVREKEKNERIKKYGSRK